MNECSACGLDFVGVRDFDSHRLGQFPQSGPSEYLDRVWAGLVDKDWTPKLGRRCLELDEMYAKGWTTDRHGRLRHPRRDTAASLHSRSQTRQKAS